MSDKDLVGFAQGLLDDDAQIEIGRVGSDQTYDVVNIVIDEATGVVQAMLRGSERRLYLAPGQLGFVLASAL